MLPRGPGWPVGPVADEVVRTATPGVRPDVGDLLAPPLTPDECLTALRAQS
jgi:hypothetical protein